MDPRVLARRAWMLLLDPGEKLRPFRAMQGQAVTVRVVSPDEFLCIACIHDCGIEKRARDVVSWAFGVFDFTNPATAMRPVDRMNARAVYGWLVEGARAWFLGELERQGVRNESGPMTVTEYATFDVESDAAEWVAEMRGKGYRANYGFVGDGFSCTARAV